MSASDDVLTQPTATPVRVVDAPPADVLAEVGGDGGVVLAVGVGSLGLDPVAREALAAVALDPDDVVRLHDPGRVPGDCTRVPLDDDPGHRGVDLLLLLGTGDSGAEALRRAGAEAARAARGRATLVVAGLPGDPDDVGVEGLVEGVVLGGYAPPTWSAQGAAPGATPVAGLLLVAPLAGARATRATRATKAVHRARATLLARNLANTPSNTKDPAWLAARAVDVAEAAGLGSRVWTEEDLRREGFGGLLAVGGGSASPPRLVEVGWDPGGDVPHVVLVGKGITFDTGGVNLKPSAGMLPMKTDMSGAAVVLAVAAACRALEVPVRVTALLPCAENAVGGGSYRPGDVVTQYGGRTVEIGNTDAEGRIVLADALAYADAHLGPDVLVDVATLTGAARVALARSMAPVYATDTALRDRLVAAGERTGEPLWAFPLVEDYRPALDSEVADVCHVAPAVGGGSVTAALFLREFTGGRRWAHLDIAGAGRSDADTGVLAKGATGYGARALLSWLEEGAR